MQYLASLIIYIGEVGVDPDTGLIRTVKYEPLLAYRGWPGHGDDLDSQVRNLIGLAKIFKKSRQVHHLLPFYRAGLDLDTQSHLYPIEIGLCQN